MNSERSSRWLLLKVGVIVLAGGGAAFFAFRPSAEWKQSDAPETGVPFICLKDGHVFQVTPARFEELSNAGGAQAGVSQSPGGEGILTLRCAKCSQMTAVRAEICPRDHTPFARRLAPGRPGRCPKCGWSFYR